MKKRILINNSDGCGNVITNIPILSITYDIITTKSDRMKELLDRRNGCIA